MHVCMSVCAHVWFLMVLKKSRFMTIPVSHSLCSKIVVSPAEIRKGETI